MARIHEGGSHNAYFGSFFLARQAASRHAASRVYHLSVALASTHAKGSVVHFEFMHSPFATKHNKKEIWVTMVFGPDPDPKLDVRDNPQQVYSAWNESRRVDPGLESMSRSRSPHRKLCRWMMIVIVMYISP